MDSRRQTYLLKNHPDVARRWIKAAGEAKTMITHANPDSKTNEIQKPGVDKAPRLPGFKRDYAQLRPSSKARHTIAHPATEHEAMGLGKGIDFIPGSRHRELGAPSPNKGYTGRDEKVAARKAR